MCMKVQKVNNKWISMIYERTDDIDDTTGVSSELVLGCVSRQGVC